MSATNPLNQLKGSTTTSNVSPTTSANRNYDAAGNLTQTLGSDGSKTLYSYDDADRLVRLERRDAAGVPQSASEWVYDYASRKPISREFTFANGAWQQTSEKRRVFAGMDVVQERNGLNQVTAQLVRSGNIGGILSRTTAAGASFYGYDGGGNVTLLTDANGQEVGHYRYDAFGNTLESSGTRAGENPYRFSTKELGSSGLYDFGYRFYLPASGIWLNRDPLREKGGVNLYAMNGNIAVNGVDPYGLRLPGPEDGFGGGGGSRGPAIPGMGEPGWAGDALDAQAHRERQVYLPFDPFGQIAMTTGGVTFYGPLYESLTDGWQGSVYYHEKVHRDQWDTYGPFNLPNNKEIEAYQVEKDLILTGVKGKGVLRFYEKNELLDRLINVDLDLCDKGYSKLKY